MSLSAWLREAAAEKVGRSEGHSLSSAGELKEFFRACDEREKGEEPDWEAHLQVLEASRRQGIPDP